MAADLEKIPALFTLNDVPVKARPGFWLMPPLLWGTLTWLAGKRRPERSRAQRLLVGALSLPLAASADLGHALTHTVTARMAGAPTEAILLEAGMTRTLYADNAVPARVHIMRSLGGPLANLLGLLVSLLWRYSAARGSLGRELAETTAATHAALAFGSLLPLPIVDGGVILKWLLVLEGNPPAQAGQMVNKAAISIGAGAIGAGAIFLALGRRTLGALLTAAGVLAAAAGLEWLK